jgi:hypothetical protein
MIYFEDADNCIRYMVAHRSPLTAHRSPLTAHRSPLTAGPMVSLAPLVAALM